MVAPAVIGGGLALGGSLLGGKSAAKNQARANRMSQAQIQKAVSSIEQWTGTPARAAQPGRGGSLLASKGATPAMAAQRGEGQKNLVITKGHIRKGFGEAQKLTGQMGESTRREIGERSEQREGDIKSNLTDRGIYSSSLGVQGEALNTQIESAELQNLQESLAGTFSALSIGKQTALAGAQDTYDTKLLQARQAIASAHEGLSFQAANSGGFGSGIAQVGGAMMANPGAFSKSGA